jgi:hypothetical protein
MSSQLRVPPPVSPRVPPPVSLLESNPVFRLVLLLLPVSLFVSAPPFMPVPYSVPLPICRLSFLDYMILRRQFQAIRASHLRCSPLSVIHNGRARTELGD